MVYEIPHFEYNSATVCILIHRQLSARCIAKKEALVCHGLRRNHKLWLYCT